MLEWIKLETRLLDDPRIQALVEDFNLAGLGSYILLRSEIDAQSGRGLPLDYVLKIGAPYTRKGRNQHIICDYGLFTEDEYGVIRACELTPAPGTSAPASPAPMLPMPASSAPDPLVKENIRRFKKPTIEEISEYCRERKNGVDAEMFFDSYEAKGWKVGGTPMKDWRAAVRTWERREGKLGGNLGRFSNPLCETDWRTVPNSCAQREVASQLIPEGAPPRPSPTAQWDFATDSWSEFY